ncbi:hypothetical protein OAO18_06490 [Francisellaceae bacterium]|nr:hypothetical protein [Francisellaceae bacterium]
MLTENPNIKKWLTQETSKKDKVISISQAVWGNRSSAYVIYRYRYSFITTLISLCYHFIEVNLLFHSQAHKLILDLFFIKLIVFILSAFFWGYTEVLRGRVKSWGKSKVSQIIEERKIWSFWGIFLGGILLILFLIFSFSINISDNITPNTEWFYNLYIIITSIELFLMFPLRVLHSSIYGRKRVFKPFYGIIGPTLISIAIMLSLWPVLGIWSIIISQLVNTLVSVFFSYLFVIKMLKKLQEAKFNFLPLKEYLLKVNRVLHWEGFLAGTTYSLFQIEGLLLITLFLWTFNAQLYTLYAIIPLIMTSYSMSKLQYFDLKRIQDKWEKNLYHKVSKSYFSLMVFTSIIYTLCALPIELNFKFNVTFMVYLFCFFLIRAVLSYIQIRIYTQHFYYKLIISAAFYIGIIILLLYLPLITVWSQLAILIGGFLVVVCWLLLPNFLPKHEDKYSKKQNICNIFTFLEKIEENKKYKTEYTVMKIHYSCQLNYYELNKIMNNLIDCNHHCFLLRNDRVSAFIVFIKPNKGFNQLSADVSLLMKGMLKTVTLQDDEWLKNKIKTKNSFSFEEKTFDYYIPISPSSNGNTQNIQNLPKQDRLSYAHLLQSKLIEQLNSVYPNSFIRLHDKEYFYKVFIDISRKEVLGLGLKQIKQ